MRLPNVGRGLVVDLTGSILRIDWCSEETSLLSHERLEDVVF